MMKAHVILSSVSLFVAVLCVSYIVYQTGLRHFIHRNKPFERDQVWVEPFCHTLMDSKGVAIVEVTQTYDNNKTIIVIKIDGQPVVFSESALRGYIKKHGLIPVKTRKD